jgi:hypothetical protein
MVDGVSAASVTTTPCPHLSLHELLADSRDRQCAATADSLRPASPFAHERGRAPDSSRIWAADLVGELPRPCTARNEPETL